MDSGLIKGFTNAFEQNAFLAIVLFGFIMGCLLIRFLLMELKGARIQTAEIIEKLNESVVDYTKAITELTTEIKHHVKPR